MTLKQTIVQLGIAAVVAVVGIAAFLLDMGGVKEWTAFVLGVLFLLAALLMLWGTFLQLKNGGLK
jgi:uncharacterized membrane protein YecN with MAPEG domain